MTAVSNSIQTQPSIVERLGTDGVLSEKKRNHQEESPPAQVNESTQIDAESAQESHSDNGTQSELYGFRHLKFLDGLRALSIFWVMGFHSNGPVGQLLSGKGGWVGVDAFFVISGFLITGILLRELKAKQTISLKNFYVRRSLRLVPVYAAWIALTCIVNPRHCTDLPAAAAIAAIYMVDFDIALLWNHIVGSGLEIGWSLSVEEKFYMLWPTVMKYVKKHLALASVVAIIFCFVWRAYLLCHGAYWIRLSAAFDTKLDAIMIGCLASIAMADDNMRKWLSRFFGSPLLSLAVFVFICAYVPFIGHPALVKGLGNALIYWNVELPVFYFSVVVLIVTMCLNPLSLPARLLSIPVLVWLGRISYSIYLWHLFAFRWSMTVPFNGQANSIENEAFRYALAVVLAAISFYCIEKPFLKLKDKYSKAHA